MSVLVLFLVFTGILPVFSDDYGRPVVSGSLQELENDELNKPTQKPNQPTYKPDQLSKPGDKPDQLGKPGKKPDQLGKPGDKLDPLGKPGDKPDQLGKPGDKPDQLGKPGQPKPPAEHMKDGDIALQIKNDTNFALMVRASIVDSSERVNLTKAKSINLAAQSQESVALSPMNAGKVSLAPSGTKTDISRDSKVLLTVNKGKETRRLVFGYAKSSGMIVLNNDLFPQTHEQSDQAKLPRQSEESEKPQQKPTSSNKAQTVYVINQTGTALTYHALLKPANFDPIQGELKPGTNVLKFSAKKASHSLSKEQLSLILQMKYDFPGSPTVTFKKEAIDLDSQPTVTLTRAIMGEPISQGKASKKLK
ncbi:MAG TPA: hypothetical protein DCG57_03185 [Candidatus Riflebacteria bacterium]|nr:hypothetical protein [Candidatus Riflebacteria bacterium]